MKLINSIWKYDSQFIYKRKISSKSQALSTKTHIWMGRIRIFLIRVVTLQQNYGLHFTVIA